MMDKLPSLRRWAVWAILSVLAKEPQVVRKTRSQFWVVSTHVLTSGFILPGAANIAVFAVVAGFHVRGLAALSLNLLALAVGYIGGIYFSLANLKKGAVVENWSECTTPSVVTFAILAALGLVLSITQLPQKSLSLITILMLFYLVIVPAFAVITRSAFAANDANLYC
jgi:hypothetical protein